MFACYKVPISFFTKWVDCTFIWTSRYEHKNYVAILLLQLLPTNILHYIYFEIELLLITTLKYKNIQLLCVISIFFCLFLFIEGKRHDASMLVESGLLANLEEYAVSETGQPMCVYGDPAYPFTPSASSSFLGCYFNK